MAPDSIYLYAEKQFRATSIYDPEYSVGGDSASGWALYASLYKTYRVVGAKITIRDVAHNTAQGAPGLLFVQVNSGETADSLATLYAAGGLTSLYNQPRCSWTAGNSNLGNDQKPYVLTKKFSARKFFGSKTWNGTQYSSNFNADPADGAHFDCLFVSTNGIQQPSPVYVHVIIDYIVLVSQPHAIGDSI